ncbi:relaxase/mobilization nuclease domain-containing protein [Haloarcula sp. JP-L23]|uniref:relaxase/mobilization nuclease domain-containing protein n=1 Tax=Haloarcula sp. JP-L23 TaxID=2716717 RepID=UPI00140F2C89|nr:relaxase [Haloarcula sp. JP-L23]
MILKTDFQRSGAGDLTRYIRRNRETDQQKVPLRDRTGRELSEDRIERFVAKSERFEFQRHLVVSPHPAAAYSPAEIDSNTREFMRAEFGHQPTTDYVYTVHDDSDIVHSHVAATGREVELRLDVDEIQRLRSRAREVFREPQRLKERAPEREAAHSAAIPDDAVRNQSSDPDRSDTTSDDSDVTGGAEPEREVTPDRDFDLGGER